MIRLYQFGSDRTQDVQLAAVKRKYRNTIGLHNIIYVYIFQRVFFIPL